MGLRSAMSHRLEPISRRHWLFAYPCVVAPAPILGDPCFAVLCQAKRYFLTFGDTVSTARATFSGGLEWRWHDGNGAPGRFTQVCLGGTANPFSYFCPAIHTVTCCRNK